jgi:carnitine O-acetyltransferase
MPFVDFCDTIINEGIVEDDCLTPDSNDASNEGGVMPKITNIFQNAFASLSPTAQSEIDKCLDKAKSDFVTLVTDNELNAQHYTKYGSTIMKKAGCSPDAYTQMAMQLASYRMFGEPLATYESTQVRKFLHGRTETTRTVSPASLAFCQAMSSNSGMNRSERFDLLQKACSSHVHYIRHALEGQGVDRHFFGLSMCIQDGEHPPDLFSHPLYEKSKRFLLSTSSLPNMAVGFGPVSDDGLGIGYEAKPDSCIFHVTARTEHEGWTEQMCEELGRALDDMRGLYDVDAGEGQPQRSRL